MIGRGRKLGVRGYGRRRKKGGKKEEKEKGRTTKGEGGKVRR